MRWQARLGKFWREMDNLDRASLISAAILILVILPFFVWMLVRGVS